MEKENPDVKRSPGRPLDTDLGPTILNAVLDTLAEGGYGQLTTAAVARRAGVSTATMYRRWPSKHDLLLAAAKQIGAGAEPPETGSLEGELTALLDRKREVLSGRVGATLVALLGEAAHDLELAAVVRESVFTPTHQHLSAILERAAARGEQVSRQSAEPAAHLIVGTILSNLAFGPTTEVDVEQREILSRREVTMLVRAISSRTTT